MVNAIVNAFGMGVGFTLALLSLGIVREIIGSGSLFGIDLFGAQFQPWAVFVLPPGGFFVLAFWLFVFSLMRKRKETRAKQEEVARAA